MFGDDHTYNSSVDENQNIDINNDVGDFVNDSLDEFIIACVQSYPHLYNKADRNYKDNSMKEKAWEEISKTCQVSGKF